MQEPLKHEQLDDLYEHACAIATEAALAAWRAIAPLYGAEYAIEHKADGPATDADRLADRVILEHLRAHFPPDTYGYLTEESVDDASRLARGRVWIIDPIDGTRDFIRGTGHFAVQIGLVERGEQGIFRPVVAVVLRPTAGLLCTAIAGRGAWRRAMDGTDVPQRLRVSTRDGIGRLRAVVSNADRTSRLARFIHGLGLESYYNIGSLGVKVCLIASGEAELYVVTGLGKVKEWDTCAPELILQEAGGRMTDLCGRPLYYNRPDPRMHAGLLASNGPAHGQLSARVLAFLQSEGVTVT